MTARFSEADMELVAQAMRDANTPEAWRDESPFVPFAHYARAVLGALVAAGRLLPDGTKTEVEWGTRILRDGDFFQVAEAGPHQVLAQARVNYHARQRDEVPGWRGSAELVRRWQHTTPWEHVDSSSINPATEEKQP